MVEELRGADRLSDDEYKTVLLAFINCLIISTPELKDRNRVRNEFIGLRLVDVLREIRGCDGGGLDCDLQVQLDVFDEQRASDEAHSDGGLPHGVDLTSHLDVFYAIYNQGRLPSRDHFHVLVQKSAVLK